MIVDILGQKPTSMVRRYRENESLPESATELVSGLRLTSEKNKC
jgi:hypothetical protein